MPSSVRLCFGQPCSPFEAGALPVLRPTRRIHIRRRGRVLCNPPHLKGFRPADGPKQSRAWHLWSSSSRGECPRLRYRSTRRCSRVFRSPSASLCCVAGIPAPCLTRACRRNPRTASPRVTPLGARPLSPLPHYMLNPFKPSQQPQSNTYRKTMHKTLSDPITNNWKRTMHIARLHSSAYGLARICSKN